MNYSQPEGFEPRETDGHANEPSHDTRMWNAGMLWEVGLILLVALALILCGWYVTAQSGDVGGTAGATRDMTWEASA